MPDAISVDSLVLWTGRINVLRLNIVATGGREKENLVSVKKIFKKWTFYRSEYQKRKGFDAVLPYFSTTAAVPCWFTICVCGVPICYPGVGGCFAEWEQQKVSGCPVFQRLKGRILPPTKKPQNEGGVLTATTEVVHFSATSSSFGGCLFGAPLRPPKTSKRLLFKPKIYLYYINAMDVMRCTVLCGICNHHQRCLYTYIEMDIHI